MTKNIGKNVSKNLMNKYIYVFYANTIEMNGIIMLVDFLNDIDIAWFRFKQTIAGQTAKDGTKDI